MENPTPASNLTTRFTEASEAETEAETSVLSSLHCLQSTVQSGGTSVRSGAANGEVGHPLVLFAEPQGGKPSGPEVGSASTCWTSGQVLGMALRALTEVGWTCGRNMRKLSGGCGGFKHFFYIFPNVFT